MNTDLQPDSLKETTAPSQSETERDFDWEDESLRRLPGGYHPSMEDYMDDEFAGRSRED